MGYGTSQSKDYTYFKIEGLKKGSQELYFKGKKKNADGKYEDIAEKPVWLDGHIVDIKTESYEYEGEIIEQIKITFNDGEDAIVLQGGYSGVMVSLVNCLLGAETLGKLYMKLYVSKSGFPTMMVCHNGESGEKLSWAITPDEIKAKLIITKLPGGKEDINKSDLITFLKEKIDNELTGKFETFIPEVKEGTPPAEEAKKEEEEDGDELPF